MPIRRRVGHEAKPEGRRHFMTNVHATRSQKYRAGENMQEHVREAKVCPMAWRHQTRPAYMWGSSKRGKRWMFPGYVRRKAREGFRRRAAPGAAAAKAPRNRASSNKWRTLTR